MRISADTWNRIIDATRAFYEGQSPAPGKGGTPATAGNRQASVILVKNSSGTDQDRFAVLGIDAPIILPDDHEDEFKRQVALSCVTPTAADHQSRFVILLEPLPSGGIGRACVDGVTIVRLQVENEDDTVAGVADNDATHLVSGAGGTCPILWKEDGTGEKWAIVRMGGAVPDGFWGKLGGATSIADNRWAYPYTEQEYQTAGTWRDKPDNPRTGIAYNSLEANNSATGVQGNGVNASNLPSGVTIQPIGPGAVVWLRPVTDCNDGSTGYVFEAVNQVDGDCEV